MRSTGGCKYSFCQLLASQWGFILLWCAALLLQISKGFAVAMQSLMANQTARALSDRLLQAEKAKGAHMNSSLNSKDRLLHDLQAQVRTVYTVHICWTAAAAADMTWQLSLAGGRAGKGRRVGHGLTAA